MDFATFTHGRVFKSGSSVWRRGTPGMSNLWARGVSELRIDYGPGYRVYFTRRGRELVILLAGGDKTTQATDIKAALRLGRNL